MYIAHKREDGLEQELSLHLNNTAKLASEFAQVFNNQEYAYICGLLHDIGKYSDAFQRRIKENGKRCDHSTAGARVVMDMSNSGKLLAYCIAGHHGGLPNYGYKSDAGEEGTLCSRLSKRYKIPNYEFYQSDNINLDHVLKSMPNLRLYKDNNHIGFTFYMFVKMIFSCLTDADYLDTENFMNIEKVNRTVLYDYQSMLDKLNKKLEEFKKKSRIYS